MRALRCSADGVRGRKQQWEKQQGPGKRRPKRGDVGIKAVGMPRYKNPAKLLSFSDLIVCRQTFLVIVFVLVRVKFAARFRRFTYMKLRTSDTLRGNLASVPGDSFGEQTSPLSGDRDFTESSSAER